MNVIRVEDGDIYLPLGANRLEVLGEPDSTLQALRDALHLSVGDWFLDLSAGVNREILIGKYSSLVPPEVEIRRVLARVAGITAVLRVTVRRFKTRSEALAVGAELQWDDAPGRVLYVEAQVTSRTAGALDLGLALPIATSP